MIITASMRPRHKAAENALVDWLAAPHVLIASMRPRHKAAENRPVPDRISRRDRASMRPRHKAAENPRRSRPR